MASYNKSPLAFDDMRALLDKAVASPRGLAVTCRSHREAFTTRARMNYLRSLDRRLNASTYPEGHPMHGQSVWDRLIMRLPPKGSPHDDTVYVEKRTLDRFVVEEIPEFWRAADVGLPDYGEIEDLDVTISEIEGPSGPPKS